MATPAAPLPVPSITPCTERKPEMGGASITVPRGATVRFGFFYCLSPGRLIVRLGKVGELSPDPTALMDQTVPPPEPVQLALPPLDPGSYVLSWSFVPAAPQWQTVAEVSVDDILRFRRIKTNQSNFPFPAGFLFLEVV